MDGKKIKLLYSRGHADNHRPQHSTQHYVTATGTAITTRAPNDSGGGKTETSAAPSSSQSYQQQLEEMELKIRYMKNDIEFKKDQMRQKNDEKEKNLVNTGKAAPLRLLASSAIKSGSGNKSFLPSHIIRPTHTVSNTFFPTSQILTRTAAMNQSKNFVNTSELKKSSTIFEGVVSNTIPVSTKTKVIYQKAAEPPPSNAYVNSSCLQVFHTAITPTKLMHAPHQPTNSFSSQTVMSSTSPVVTISSQTANLPPQNHRIVIPPFKSHQNYQTNALNKPNQTTSLNLRYVINPKSKSSSQSQISHSTPEHIATPAQPIIRQPSTTASFISINHLSQSPKSIHQSMIASQSTKLVPEKSSQSAPQSKYKYKYVAPSSMKWQVGKSSSSDSDSGVYSTSSHSIGPFKYQQSSRFPHTTIIQRQSSKEGNLTKRATPLKVITAAKLITKYKLKRLSPTSALKTAPRFCHPSISSSRKPVTNKATSSSVFPSSRFKSGNRFKLDKRKLNFSSESSRSYSSSDSHGSPDVSNSRIGINNMQFGSKVTAQHAQKCPSLVCDEGKHKWVNPSLRAKYSRRKSTTKKSVNVAAHHIISKHKWDHRSEKVSHLRNPSLIKKYNQTLWTRRWKLSEWHHTSRNSLNKPLPNSKFKWLSSHLQTYGKPNRFSITGKQTTSMHHLIRNPLKHSLGNGYGLLRPSQKSMKLVMIGGVVYRSSPNSLTRSEPNKAKTYNAVGRFDERGHYKRNRTSMRELKRQHEHTVKLVHLRGVRYHMDSKGRKLCRVNAPGVASSASRKAPETSLRHTRLWSQSHSDLLTKVAASRAVQRSIAFVAAKHKKDNRLKKRKKQNCIFFGRFGKCHRGGKCPYTHDPKQVAMCTRFMRGKCDVENCSFSHDASVHKMPVCLYYLQGLCSREDCLYLHVNVSGDAPPCKDFLQGYCPLGLKCKKLHSFVCPSYAVFGKCPKGDDCSLLHRQSRKSQITSLATIQRPQASASSSSRQCGRAGTDKSEIVPSESESVHVSSSPSLTPGSYPSSDSTFSSAEETVDSIVSQSRLIASIDRSIPLSSQPVFISLSAANSTDLRKYNASQDEKRIGKVTTSKTKIKPEFPAYLFKGGTSKVYSYINPRESFSNDDMSIVDNNLLGKEHVVVSDSCEADSEIMDSGKLSFSVDNRTDVENSVSSKLSSSADIKSDTDNSGFINMNSPSLLSPIGGAADNDEGLLKFESNGSSQISLGFLNERKRKSALSRESLLKGIRPNFLPKPAARKTSDES